MGNNALIAYHGTPFFEQILKEGLIALKSSPNGVGCPHIWLAVKPEDAAVFGTVLEVNMDGLDFDFMDRDEPEYEYWQGCYHGGNLGSERIKLYINV